MKSPASVQPSAENQPARRVSWRLALAIGGSLLLVVVMFAVYLRSTQSAATLDEDIDAGKYPAGNYPAGNHPVSALKIYLPESGIYSINQEELRSAGWDAPLDDTSRFELLYIGRQQPFWIDKGPQGSPRLRFYAQPSASQYSVENVYVLHDRQAGELWPAPEESQRITPAPVNHSYIGLENLPPDSYFAVQHSEKNLLYLPQAEGDERWFWSALHAPQSQTIEIPADSLAAGAGAQQAHLTVRLYASTEATQNPDHRLRLLVNDQLVADESWDGRGIRQVETWFDAGLLVEGANRVALEAPGIPGVVADLLQLDWVELGYPRLLNAEQDRLEFWSPGGELSLQGFTTPVAVYDITDPENATRLDSVAEQGDAARIASQAGHRYVVVGSQGSLKPARLTPLAVLPDLLAANEGADYVAIGPADLLEPLKPLLGYRLGQGLQVRSITAETIYDQFNYGLPEPQAIQRFMQYAAENWQPAPRYLLLVGDASYDPKGYQAPGEANRLPTFLIDTVFGGQTASDVDFVQVNNDPWPDLAVGRVPARTAQQVADFVKKTILYEDRVNGKTLPPGVLAIADGQDASFAADAQAFLDVFGQEYRTQLVAPPAGSAGAAGQILDLIDQGQSLVAYFGHGSLNMWGKDRLFTVEDATGMRNLEHLPVVLNLTCLTGLFTHPKIESLSEALLFNPSGGAVAVLAPSSLTLAADQSFLSRPLARELVNNPSATLGEAHLAARRQVSLDSPGSRDVMMTFMLFGDPALRLHPTGN